MALDPRSAPSRSREMGRNLAERRDQRLEEAAVRLAAALSKDPIGVSWDQRLPEGQTLVTEELLAGDEIGYLSEARVIVNLIADAVKDHSTAVNLNPLNRSR